MCNNKKVTIIIPTFNRGDIIGKTIESALNQKYSNTEIIVVDDGSTDKTKDVVESFKSSKIKYIYKENGGASSARNRGIAEASGEFISFLDSDDYMLKHHIEKSLPILLNANNICTYSKIIVDRGDGVTFLKPHREYRQHEDISEYLFCNRGFVQTSSLILRTKLASKVKYDETISAGDDNDFAIRLINNGAKLIMLDDPGIIWNDSSSPSRLSNANNPEERERWLKKIKPIITKKAFYSEMGWRVAKCYAKRFRYDKALYLYIKALIRGSYSVKMSIVVLSQIIIPSNIYRKLANKLVEIGVKP